MAECSIRSAFPAWPELNGRLRDAVVSMTDEQLLLQPSPDRWPLWATIGHLACQRVFWLCDFAGEPGAETTRFTNAGWDCPGDDDLEHVLASADLVEALDSTYRIVDGLLDRWTFDSLVEQIDRTQWGPSRIHTRGWIIQRVYGHDVWSTRR
jgi:DinB family protein